MYRNYDPGRDLAAVKRIWLECGWIENEEEGECIRDFFAEGETLVGLIDDTPECAVHGAGGTIQYGRHDAATQLRLGAVAAVTTSHLARRSGYAKMLTAELLARQAADGAHVSALGMFDQGFYDRLGFGTGCYEHWINFDPATLMVPPLTRPPKRLTRADFAHIHAASLARLKGHGAVCLDSPYSVRAELTLTDKPFGLGYFDGPDGTLSHYIWGETKGENGPYTITWRAYRNHDQLIELLSLMRSLGDQVSQIGTLEFGEIQVQDLLDRPFRNRRASLKGTFEQSIRAAAYWQLRVLDLDACIAAAHFPAGVRFNLALDDPAPEHLPDGNDWPGLTGTYVVDLGPESSIRPGAESTLPTLDASVNAFSRLLFGVQPATSLAATDRLSGDPALLRRLDDVISLPPPHFGWDF